MPLFFPITDVTNRDRVTTRDRAPVGTGAIVGPGPDGGGPFTPTLPAGADTQIQYNENGAFGASAGLVWDRTLSMFRVGVSGLTPVTPSLTKQFYGGPAGDVIAEFSGSVAGAGLGVYHLLFANRGVSAGGQYIAGMSASSGGSDANTGQLAIGVKKSPSDTFLTSVLHMTNGGSLVVGADSALATNATDGFLYISGGAGTPTGTPTAFLGKYPLYWDSTASKLWAYSGSWLGLGTGTVTSVGLSVPSFLSVAGSPVTTSGTLAVSLATQSANKVFAGPTTGSAAAPTFRSLVAADLAGLGLGDFVGPSGATANALVRFNGTTGKLGKDSNVTLADSGTALVFSAGAGLTSGGTGDIQLTTAGTYVNINQAANNGNAIGLQLGNGRTASGYAFIDLIGDGTYTDYGLRIIRNDTGANTPSDFVHRGTGNLRFYLQDSGSTLQWIFNGTSKLDMTTAGALKLGGYGAGTLRSDASGNITSVSSGVGTGDFVGPSSATDNAVVRFDTTTGKLGQNSVVTIDDSGNVLIPSSDTSGYVNVLKVQSAATSGNVLQLHNSRTSGSKKSQISFLANTALTWGIGTDNAETGGDDFYIYQASASDFRFQIKSDGKLRLKAYGSGLLSSDGSGNITTTTAGAGDFVGPASSTDKAVLLFNGTTGKLGQNSDLIYSSSILTLANSGTSAELNFPCNVSSLNANTLTVRTKSSNTETQLNLAPSGTATNVAFVLHGNSDVDASAHNAFGFGGGFAGAVAGSWNFGSYNVASASSASRPISFIVSNSTDGRIETLRLKNSGQLYLPYSKPEIQFEVGANNINSLSFRANTANTDTFINILPSGTATNPSILLYGGNDPDVTGTNILGFGGGFAGAVAGSWNFGSINRASAASAGRPFSFVVQNATDSRIEALRINNDCTAVFTRSILWGTGGTYAAGSIYADANWGVIFRAKTASPASADFAFQNSAGTERLRIDGTVATFAGAIKTANPSGGTAQNWKLGSYVGGAPTATGYAQIEIGGTAYKVLVST